MAIRAKLKFKGDLPWNLEHALITKWGFRVSSRAGREWVIVEKQDNKIEWLPEVLINGELPDHIQAMLINRCNTIVNHFTTPHHHWNTIKARLDNIARTLPPIQAQFVRSWSDRNCIGE